MLAIIFAIGFYNNAKYQESLDFGYATSGVISVDLMDSDDFEVYKNEILEKRSDLVIAGTKDHVVNSVYKHSAKHESIEKIVEVLDVGENYIEALNIRILEGRSFQRDSETDRKESVIVTEEFVKQFGWNKSNAIGKRIVWNDTTQLYVIGVSNDLFTHSLYEPVVPVMLRYIYPNEYIQLIVSTTQSEIAGVEEFLKDTWTKLFKNMPYNALRNDVVRASSNRVNINGVKIVGCLGMIALLMSVTGLYTMVSLNITSRTKEIGIRKIMGATKWQIARVINMEFIIILICAAIIGGLLGKTLIDNVMTLLWMYYMKLHMLALLFCLSAMLLLAFMILGIKTYITASQNPTKTIRSE
jgi:ABC-type antimicrobial peptide transport system permease subunit